MFIEPALTASTQTNRKSLNDREQEKTNQKKKKPLTLQFNQGLLLHLRAQHSYNGLHNPKCLHDFTNPSKTV